MEARGRAASQFRTKKNPRFTLFCLHFSLSSEGIALSDRSLADNSRNLAAITLNIGHAPSSDLARRCRQDSALGNLFLFIFFFGSTCRISIADALDVREPLNTPERVV